MVFSFLKKQESGGNIKNWYEDRYQTILIQRNFLVVITVLCLVAVILAMIANQKVQSARTLDPFVVEIEKKTGIPTVVTPVEGKVYSQDAAVVRYFLAAYVNARESFSAFTYKYNYNDIVFLMSTQAVMLDFRRRISADNPDSPIKYAENVNFRRDVSITSMSKLPDTGEFITYQVEFIVKDSVMGSGTRDSYKVATISYSFVGALELSDKERYINPLGFQVQYYSVADRVVNEK